jgi:molecular chaperone GrpE (heat shock protein)
MAELNRKEARLTTADIAARTTSPATGSQVQSGIAREDHDEGISDRRMAVLNETTSGQNWDNNTPATTADEQVRDSGPVSPLFSDSDIGDLRSRWSNVQADFVDEPRRAVEDADQLVATVMQRLAEGFAKERDSLEKQWDSGETASTEDLRMALQRYRAFFNRLLSAA